MKTEVTENIFEQAWDGFKGTNWRDKASVTALYKKTTNHMMVMKAFLLGQQNVHLK